MRTTMKRGIGQGAVLSGSGEAAAPLFGPMARYRHPVPPRRSVFGVILRGLGWLVVAPAVLGSGVAGVLYLYTHESLAYLSQPTRVTKIAAGYVSPIKSPSD